MKCPDPLFSDMHTMCTQYRKCRLLKYSGELMDSRDVQVNRKQVWKKINLDCNAFYCHKTLHIVKVHNEFGLVWYRSWFRMITDNHHICRRCLISFICYMKFPKSPFRILYVLKWQDHSFTIMYCMNEMIKIQNFAEFHRVHREVLKDLCKIYFDI